jgi:hypothetical protein
MKNDYQDTAGIYTGTLAQKKRKHAQKKHHHHHKNHKGDEFIQTSSEGFPVYVNPESVLYPNVVEKFPFGETYKVGLDDIDLVQTKEQGFPVYVNPESVLYPNVLEKF